ncbi:MAG TPA: amidohydrolase family protein [Candidatus Dormibacteraeota bacterium]
MSLDRWHLRAVLLPCGMDPVDLWVAGGRLTAEPQDGAETLPGGWVLPGLVDAHAHLSIDIAGTGLERGSPELVDANLRAHLETGVLLVRDLGAVPGATLPRGGGAGPRLLRAGRFLAPPGRYIPGLHEGVGPGEVVDAARAEVASGATWVKVVADFPERFPDGGPAEPNYDLETLTRLVDAVHAAGARVAAHVTGRALADVVTAGVDSIEHGVRMDGEALGALGRRGGAWTPTLATTTEMLGDERFARLVDRLTPLLAGAAAAGVTVLAGTDTRPAGSLAAEVALLQRCGLSPVDAMAAASTSARRYLGLPGLEDGAPADLVCYAADPRDDPEVLGSPAAVLVGGRLVRPDR